MGCGVWHGDGRRQAEGNAAAHGLMLPKCGQQKVEAWASPGVEVSPWSEARRQNLLWLQAGASAMYRQVLPAQ